MPRNLSFVSAFALPGVTPEQVLEFHRSRYGALRMSSDDSALNGGGGDGGAADGGAANAGSSSPTDEFVDRTTGEKFQFPPNKPTADMTAEQRSEYWRHKAQKHETRANARADYDEVKAERDRIKQAAETDNEKAIREAREQGAAEARKETSEGTVAAMLRMGLRGRGVTDDSELDDLVETIKLSAHVDDKGRVNDEKVLRTIERLAGKSGSGPDMGQGRRGGADTKSKAEAGRAEAQKRFGDKKVATA